MSAEGEITIGRTKVVWNAQGVRDAAHRALAKGIDVTMEKCVIRARDDHEYMTETGHLERSVDIMRFAELDEAGGVVSGTWGARAKYAIYVEIGTSRKDSGAPTAPDRALAARGHMWEIAPPQPMGKHTPTQTRYNPDGQPFKVGGAGPLMEARLSLRPAASIEYRMLPFYIREAWRAEQGR